MSHLVAFSLYLVSHPGADILIVCGAIVASCWLVEPIERLLGWAKGY